MRVIGRLRFGLALGAPRFGATDRGDARSRRGRRRRERFGRCLRLRVSVTATSGLPRFRMLWVRGPGLRMALLGSSWFGMLRLGSSRFGVPRLALAALGVTRLALTAAPRLAATA